MSGGKRPNFLIILADDLGFSDLGCFGGEIKTPNLDALGQDGVRFTNFHTAAACSPTRSMIMTGTDNHLNGLGGMIEAKSRKEGQKHDGKPGHEGYLSQKVVTLPEVLRDAGYHTMMTGKWHLGRDKTQTPASRGFDRDWSFMWGCHNHYAYEPQFEPQTNADDAFMEKWLLGMVTKHDMYTVNGKFIDVEANFPKKDDGFYSTDTFTEKLLGFMQERSNTPKLKAKPFFAYHAFTAPHFPLQAPKSRRDKYKGLYNDGPGVLREQRLAKLKKLGLIGKDVVPHPTANPFDIKQWEEMTAEEKEKSARAMETYAAMVEMIDESVGRVVDQLKKDGEFDNTMIIFMSDNGAEGAACEAYPVVGDNIMRCLKRWYNNDIDNIGEPDSFVWYGSFWAQAATAPGRLWKMCSSQGGIRVPFLVHYPFQVTHLQPGSISHEFGTCMDLMPTMIDLAGAKHPTASDGMFHGNKVIPMTGKSWSQWIQGQSGEIHKEGTRIGWELHGRAAFRINDWKILYMPPPFGKGAWELFDLKSDPGETKDLAKEQPGRLEEMLKGWDEYVLSNGVVWGLKGDPDPQSNPNFDDETADPKAWMSVGKGTNGEVKA